MNPKNSIIYSDLSSKIIERFEHSVGMLYFLEDAVVSEIHDGEHLNIDNSKLLIDAINLYFREDPYGYISNRVNDFSVSPLDLHYFKEKLKSARSYCTVTYNSYKRNAIKIEELFFKTNKKDFDSLTEAYNWTKSQCVLK